MINDFMVNNNFIYGYIKVEVGIKTLTGLRIGGRKETIEIGGTDLIVIKDPVTELPYIPGSSLKGKLRSLIEKIEGMFGVFEFNNSQVPKEEIYKFLEDIKNKKIKIESPEPFGINIKDDIKKDLDILRKIATDFPIIRMFGNHKGDPGVEPRLIIRDFLLDVEKTKKSLNIRDGDIKDKIYEIKPENVINRIDGKAKDPREVERITRNVVFKGELIYKMLGWGILGENEVIEQTKVDIEKLKKAMEYLVKYDYLGGSGTRGYGKVAICIEKIEIEDIRGNKAVLVWKNNNVEIQGNVYPEITEKLKEFMLDVNKVSSEEEKELCSIR